MFNLTPQKVVPEQYQEPITDLDSVKRAFPKLYRFLDLIVRTFNFNVQNLTDNLRPMGTLQTLSATDRISHPPDTVEGAGNGGAVTLTSVPTISAGYAGERILIIGTSDVNTVTVQDSSSLTGSLLQLSSGANKTLGANDTLYLVYSPTNGAWCQVTTENN